MTINVPIITVMAIDCGVWYRSHGGVMTRSKQYQRWYQRSNQRSNQQLVKITVNLLTA